MRGMYSRGQRVKHRQTGHHLGIVLSSMHGICSNTATVLTFDYKTKSYNENDIEVVEVSVSDFLQDVKTSLRYSVDDYTKMIKEQPYLDCFAPQLDDYVEKLKKVELEIEELDESDNKVSKWEWS